jgi:hypothetical protein
VNLVVSRSALGSNEADVLGARTYVDGSPWCVCPAQCFAVAGWLGLEDVLVPAYA